jgi:pimeloyl-ACP methyl ester carboxylesterase
MASTLIQPHFDTAALATGVRLRYHEQGDAAGDVLVLVHGWPDSWYSYSRMLAHLPRRYHAFAVDLRGFGGSDRPATGYAIDDLAADVVAFLDAVGAERATLVGHSMGTFVVRSAARLAPARVQRLVLIGSAHTTVNDVLKQVHGLVADLTDPVPVEFAREFQAGTVHRRLPEAFFDGIVAESATLPARIWRATFDAIMAFDDSAALATITAPTLAIWGVHDGLFDRAQQDLLVGAMPDARLHIYPDSGHCPNWEQPDRVVADIDAFVAGGAR